MLKFTFLPGLLLFLAAACKEKTTPSADPEPVAAERPTSQKPEAGTSDLPLVRYTYQGSADSIATPDGKATLIQPATIEPRIGELLVTLTMHLRQYMEKNGRAPSSVTELIASKMDSAPQAPSGTMYVIDANNKEVRLVKTK